MITERVNDAVINHAQKVLWMSEEETRESRHATYKSSKDKEGAATYSGEHTKPLIL